MKKNNLLLLLSICLFQVQFLKAQKQSLEIITQFAVTRADTVINYCYVYKDYFAEKYDAKYIFILYNQNMIQTDEFSFLIDKEYQFVNVDGMKIGSGNRLLFCFNWPSLKEQKIVIADVLKKQVIGGKIRGMAEWYLLPGNKIMRTFNEDKLFSDGIKTIEILDDSLSRKMTFDITDKRNKISTLRNQFFVNEGYIAFNVTRSDKYSTKKIMYDQELWVLSLRKMSIHKIPINHKADSSMYSLSNIVSSQNEDELILYGKYREMTGTLDAFAIPSTILKGMFIWKLNMQDTASISIHKKTYLWDDSFKYVIPKREHKSLKDGDFIDIQNVFYDAHKTYMLFNVKKYESEFYMGESMDSRSFDYVHLPTMKDDFTASNIVKNSLFIMELDSQLNILNIASLYADTISHAISYEKDKPVNYSVESHYNPVTKKITIVSSTAGGKKELLPKPKIVSLIYEKGKSIKSDELDFNERALWTKFFPAKLGYILIVEYLEDEKRMEKRLERLNY